MRSLGCASASQRGFTLGALGATVGSTPRRTPMATAAAPLFGATLRWCSSPTTSSSTATPAASRFSRSRPGQTGLGTDTQRVGGTSSAKQKPLFAGNLFASPQVLGRALQGILRECAHGLTDARRESYVAQLSHGSLRQLTALDGKLVLLCLDTIRALTLEMSASMRACSPTHALDDNEASFCASSCAHLVEEAAQWLQAQGEGVDTNLAVRLVCALSDLGLPSRVAVLTGLVQRLSSSPSSSVHQLNHIPDNTRVALLTSLCDVLAEDPYNETLQNAVSAFYGGASLQKGQLGSAVLSLAEQARLLEALSRLTRTRVTCGASLTGQQLAWAHMLADVWTAIVHAQARDPSLEAVSLETGVQLWQALRCVQGVADAERKTLTEAVLRRLAHELPARVARGDGGTASCSGVLVAQILLQSRETIKASSVESGSEARENAVRLYMDASRVYQDILLRGGVATAVSAGPVHLALATLTNEKTEQLASWESTLLPMTLRNTRAGREPSHTTSADDELLKATQAALEKWVRERTGTDGTTLLADTTPPHVLTTILLTQKRPKQDAVIETKPLVAAYSTYLESLVEFSDDSSHPTDMRSRISVTPAVLFPLVLSLADLSDGHRAFLEKLILLCMNRWNVLQVVGFLQFLSVMDDSLTRNVLHLAAGELVKHVAHATAAQLGALLLCYGRAGVRQDDFCQAATKRVHVLLNPAAASLTSNQDNNNTLNNLNGATGQPASSPLPPSRVAVYDVAQILAGLAVLEHNNTAPFLDAAPLILANLATLTDPFVVAQLMAAYARMLIWDFPLFWALADRLATLATAAAVPLSTLVTALLALTRMDVPHKPLVTVFMGRVAMLRGHVSTALSQDQAILLLSVLSRLDWAGLAEPTKSPTGSCDAPDAVVALVAECRAVLLELKFAVTSDLDQLNDPAVAEIALCLSRLGLLHDSQLDSSNASGALAPLLLRAITMAPSASGTTLSHLATAFSRGTSAPPSAELFAVIADRAVSIKSDISAATHGAILAAFAEAHVENDRLFVEVLPRVRYVADYGTPTDLTNVVHAYATVHIWHYKLFSRIAERAIQVRHEFTCPTLTRFLEAYAKVGMRQDKLLLEMAGRAELLAELMTPAQLASVAQSYAKLNTKAEPVFQSCAQQVVARPETFSKADAETLLYAFQAVDFASPEATAALTARFPELTQKLAHEQDAPHDSES